MNSKGTKPRKLYDFLFSGNGYKIRLALSQLKILVEYEFLDITKGETRSEYFTDKNPMGQIPVLELEDGTLLRESNAILVWLTEGSELMPRDSLEHAQVLQWMFFEQSNIDKALGRCRFMQAYPDFKKMLPPGHLEMCEYLGNEALGVLNKHLSEKQFLVGEQYTAADISVFAYVHCSEEGGFNLNEYPAVNSWCRNIKSQNGYIPINHEPT